MRRKEILGHAATSIQRGSHASTGLAVKEACRDRVLEGEELKIGLSFGDDALERWALNEPFEIGNDTWMSIRERCHDDRIEQRRRRGAVGDAHLVADCPSLARHVP